MALCFALGSTCFLIGPFPGYAQLVGESADAITFFVGSILFTAGGGLQSWLAWSERHSAGGGGAGWWAAIIQSAGTLFFNVTTYQAMHTALTSPEYNKLVWRPDWRGSICFLVSGAIAYRASSRHGWLPVRGGAGWWQPAVNLLGCVFFGISAVAGYVVPSTGSMIDQAAPTGTHRWARRASWPVRWTPCTPTGSRRCRWVGGPRARAQARGRRPVGDATRRRVPSVFPVASSTSESSEAASPEATSSREAVLETAGARRCPQTRSSRSPRPDRSPRPARPARSESVWVAWTRQPGRRRCRSADRLRPARLCRRRRRPRWSPSPLPDLQPRDGSVITGLLLATGRSYVLRHRGSSRVLVRGVGQRSGMSPEAWARSYRVESYGAGTISSIWRSTLKPRISSRSGGHSRGRTTAKPAARASSRVPPRVSASTTAVRRERR